MRHDDDYTESVPNLAKRNPERAGKPRSAREDNISAALERRARDAMARWQARAA
jgi:hypothetical protein